MPCECRAGVVPACMLLPPLRLSDLSGTQIRWPTQDELEDHSTSEVPRTTLGEQGTGMQWPCMEQHCTQKASFGCPMLVTFMCQCYDDVQTRALLHTATEGSCRADRKGEHITMLSHALPHLAGWSLAVACVGALCLGAATMLFFMLRKQRLQKRREREKQQVWEASAEGFVASDRAWHIMLASLST